MPGRSTAASRHWSSGTGNRPPSWGSSRGRSTTGLRRCVGHLRSALDAIQRQREEDPRALDVIAATGELLSSQLVAAAMTARGLDAVWIDARDAVKTDDRYTCAGPLTDATDAACAAVVAPRSPPDDCPVLGGFIGGAPDGSTTTLGRGGSDYSASIIGAGYRRGGDSDLDRRRRHADGGSARGG